MATLTIDNLPDDVIERFRAEASRDARTLEDVARDRLLEAAAEPAPRRAIPPRDQSDLAERLARVQVFHDELAARGVMVDPEQLRQDIREGRP